MIHEHFERTVIGTVILCGGLFLGAFPAAAGEMLDWQACVKEAREKNPSLLAAKAELNQAISQEGVVISDSAPQITSGFSRDTSKSSSSAKWEDTYSYDITGRQLLFDGFKSASDVAAAIKNIKASEYNYNVTSSDIRFNLRLAFAELLRAHVLLAITTDILERREQNLKLVNLRYEAGREHRGSLLLAQADVAQARYEVSQAERNIDLAEGRLAKALGRTIAKDINVSGDFTVRDTQREKPEFVPLAENNPFLMELVAKKNAARFGVNSAESEFFPKVYVNASRGGSASGRPFKDQNEWSAGLEVSFPLFEGGGRMAELSKARAVYSQARAEEKSGLDSVVFTLEDTWKKLQDAQDEVVVRREYLAAAEERAKISRAQYSSGLTSFDNWIIIEDNLVSAKKNFLNTQANSLIAEAAWIQAKGGTLDHE